MMSDVKLHCGDALAVMRAMEPASVDLVFGSPPYEAARSYGIGFNLEGQAWVDWMVTIVQESLRLCRGLVAFVVEGRTRHYAWSGTPALLMADLLRAGITLRKPPAFYRFGVWGSGGRDWLRNDYEFIICATHGGRLPWSDNKAMGGPPKYKAGGKPTNRKRNGTRNTAPSKSWGAYTAGDPSVKCNPGNVIHCNVGGGKMGDRLCHENEAPFPESLAESFVRSFCPPGGVVLDPFCGSGTTGKVALAHGRKFIGIDIRPGIGGLDTACRRLGLPPTIAVILDMQAQEKAARSLASEASAASAASGGRT